MWFKNKRSAANCNLILEKGHFRGQGQIRISQMNLFDPSLGPEQLLDQIAWHAVEKQAHHDQQQQSQDDLDDEPFVAVAYQVADGLQRAQKPQEGGVRPAVIEVVKGLQVRGGELKSETMDGGREVIQMLVVSMMTAKL